MLSQVCPLGLYGSRLHAAGLVTLVGVCSAVHWASKGPIWPAHLGATTPHSVQAWPVPSRTPSPLHHFRVLCSVVAETYFTLDSHYVTHVRACKHALKNVHSPRGWLLYAPPHPGRKCSKTSPAAEVRGFVFGVGGGRYNLEGGGQLCWAQRDS